MNKKLICYFSASGTTKSVAEKIVSVLEGDLFEIVPKRRYTSEDLDWHNDNSRSSLEMKDKSSRPEIENKVSNIDDYNTVIIGFPVWWYTAPTIINTFFEENNFEGKNIYVFVTSGSSPVDDSFNDLKNTYSNLNFVSGKRLTGNESLEEILEWINK